MSPASHPPPAAGLRRRLVASLVAAALLPFAAAWWIAHGYVADEARDRVEARLTFDLRIGAREFEGALDDARDRARMLAADRRVQVALLRDDLPALQQLLLPRESAVLVGGLPAGDAPTNEPHASVLVRSGGRTVGTIVVALPPAASLLARASRSTGGADRLAIVRSGRIANGPERLRGTLLENPTRLEADGHRYRVRMTELPGYSPRASLAALADDREIAAVVEPLRRRLALAGGLSLMAIGLLAAILARPLLRGLGRVESVAEQAVVDPLTGLANRRGFEEALAAEIERSSRTGAPCSLVLADLDDFKSVNDSHGHDTGDEALRAVAAVLVECTRTNDVAARPGGEEFALILPGTATDAARETAERVRRSLATRDVEAPSGERLRLTASFGVAEASGDTPAAELVRLADEALYAAKHAGKDRVAVAAA